MYRLAGMPYALNVWIYECASIVGDEISVKEDSYIPRICNWRIVEVKPKFGMFMSSIFAQNISGTSSPSTMPDFNQEDHFVRPLSTGQLFEQWSSPIVMDVPNNDPIEVDVVDAQEQNLIPEQKVVEDVDTCKDKEGRKDVSALPHTTHVHDEASVYKKDNGLITSNSVSFGTQEALDTLHDLCAPMDAQPLQVVTPQQVTDTHDMISDESEI
uniref:Ulp1 protease family, C-terminal catalytic domain containing protein n=1 Tax=Solanum tuberosum TaxID=4113 RepID=M1DCY1_SOLTU